MGFTLYFVINNVMYANGNKPTIRLQIVVAAFHDAAEVKRSSVHESMDEDASQHCAAQVEGGFRG
ncbi:MAG: hypothetical protein LBI68_08840, partial [Azoarcus sp.]|nr:hypothetical protein [Azoarcus sp.]